ncbi:MAG: 16S rRNA (cytosine(1402)-N(4))-methyltransferase RsmH [Myxococcota bacterium]|nr:16S rRNA (cytosine(1402)-N(4))-methyltransferase RsmH [Myxococcota bacterium]
MSRTTERRESEDVHIPVLLEVVLEVGAPQPGERWVDCTLGRGGHSEALLKRGVELVAIDQDPAAIDAAAQRLDPYRDQLELIAGNFRELPAHLEAIGWGSVDGILADLGVSSPQLDEAARGFSFLRSGPVDMRMNLDAGESAEQWLMRCSVDELTQVLREYGEESFARPISRAIKGWAEGGGGDTCSLASTIEAALPARERRRRKHHPATKSFQAIRIRVNDELGALDALLERAPGLLRPGGRALFITFHSLEDRRVKAAIRRLTEPPPSPRRGLPPPPSAPLEFERRLRKARRADQRELGENPRARSATLRALHRRSIATE